MRYELAFHPAAWAEWQALDGSVRSILKRKLAERLEQPRVPAAQRAGHPDRYKIKLRSAGYRLVYELRDAEVVVIVIAVGKRERSAVYRAAGRR